MPSLGWQELVIVLIIVVIIFGAGKLPEIGGAMGKSIKEFKKSAGDEFEEGSASLAAEVQSSAAPVAKPAAKPAAEAQVRADEI